METQTRRAGESGECLLLEADAGYGRDPADPEPAPGRWKGTVCFQYGCQPDPLGSGPLPWEHTTSHLPQAPNADSAC